MPYRYGRVRNCFCRLDILSRSLITLRIIQYFFPVVVVVVVVGGRVCAESGLVLDDRNPFFFFLGGGGSNSRMARSAGSGFSL